MAEQNPSSSFHACFLLGRRLERHTCNIYVLTYFIAGLDSGGVDIRDSHEGEKAISSYKCN